MVVLLIFQMYFSAKKLTLHAKVTIRHFSASNYFNEKNPATVWNEVYPSKLYYVEAIIWYNLWKSYLDNS